MKQASSVGRSHLGRTLSMGKGHPYTPDPPSMNVLIEEV